MKKLLTIFITILIITSCEDGDISSSSFAGTGTGGSLASFMVTGKNLYVLAGSQLKTFNVEEGDGLEQKSTLYLPSWLETIFLYETRLFVGSNNAVHFLDIDDTDNPVYISSWQHVTSCDPVVARHGIAYSTIRVTDCRSGRPETRDQLDVINIKDIRNPTLLNSQQLDTPFGLAITANYLFVCEQGGISVFDNSDPENPVWRYNAKLGEGVAKDIIVRNGHLIVVTTEGIFNVSVDDDGMLTQRGRITD